ncbi:hypothetical protein L596_012339 [Steinernema carpocapsae]|uniref:Uncharacterized protein n=1 Tax=Steinernema carpocapsae TaxID=34508 RepID=A0A4U5NWV9_STECR|nr:hypothetical protein L596_012339 [Steinernema carpocapsae]
MCLAEEGAVWEGSFCQIKCPVTGRSVVHAFSRNAVFFVKLSQAKDAQSSNSLITILRVVQADTGTSLWIITLLGGKT